MRKLPANTTPIDFIQQFGICDTKRHRFTEFTSLKEAWKQGDGEVLIYILWKLGTTEFAEHLKFQRLALDMCKQFAGNADWHAADHYVKRSIHAMHTLNNSVTQLAELVEDKRRKKITHRSNAYLRYQIALQLSYFVQDFSSQIPTHGQALNLLNGNLIREIFECPFE